MTDQLYNLTSHGICPDCGITVNTVARGCPDPIERGFVLNEKNQIVCPGCYGDQMAMVFIGITIAGFDVVPEGS